MSLEKSKYEFTRILKNVFNAKVYVLLFGIVGLIMGLIKNSIETSTEYNADGSLIINCTDGEIAVVLLNNLNHMSIKTRAEKLNVSPEIASKFISWNGRILYSPKVNDIYIIKPQLIYNFSFYERISFKPLIKGVVHYLKSNSYLKKEHQQYLKRRKIRSEMIKSIDQEIDYHDSCMKNDVSFQDVQLTSFEKLYDLKLKITADLLDDSNVVTLTNIDVPHKVIPKTNILKFPILLSFVGGVFGFLIYFFKKNKEQVHAEINYIFKK